QVISFGSWPVLVEDFLVVVLLQLSRSAFDAHYRLRKSSIESYHVEQSFLDATISEFLAACAECLSKPNPGAELRLVVDEAEVFRAAAKDLMAAPTLAGGNE